MCYQCSGCGRCLERQLQNKDTSLCPCCHREVPAKERTCPFCGMFIRPRAGSVPVKRPATPRGPSGKGSVQGKD